MEFLLDVSCHHRHACGLVLTFLANFCSTLKMANSSISYEILSSFSMRDYREYCRTLNEHHALTLEEFSNLPIATRHFVDIHYCFVENVFNPNHMLDYFTRFSDLTCLDLRKKVIELVKTDIPFWSHISAVVLP